MKKNNQKLLIRRKTANQKRGQETTKAILEATKIILRTEGITSLNTNSIAEKAGVSIGSIYQYFPNKKAILIECYHQHKNELLDLMKSHIGQVKGESLEFVIEKIVYALLKAHQHDKKFHQVITNAVDIIIGKDKNKDVKLALFLFVLDSLKDYRHEINHDNFELAIHVFYQTIQHLIHFVVSPDSHSFEAKDYLAMIIDQGYLFLSNSN